ncbi:hypothetical protein AX14_010975 [Amanita brunnescens Koide BX004]|nr:hypothetical protein AX14_010975 [Amanita brunnescens Koide BX004]
MPTSFIQVSPAQTSEVGVTPSFMANLTQDTPDIVNTRRVTNETVHHKWEALPRVPCRVRSNEVPSLPVPKRRMTNVISITSRAEKGKGTHREIEARMRISPKTTNLWSDKTAPEGSQGHSIERSDAELRPAVEQALVCSSLNEGEERRACDAVVKMYDGKVGVTDSPRHSAALTLSAPAPDAPPAPLVRVVPLLQRPDELAPSFEMAFSQRLETALEQPSPSESVIEKGSSIPRVLLSPSMCAKIQEQSVKTVLAKELPEGSSLTNRVLSNGVVPVSASSNRSEGHISAKGSTDKVNVSSGKDWNAARHSPISKAALKLRIATPFTSIQASSKDGAFPFSQTVSTLSTSSERNSSPKV